MNNTNIKDQSFIAELIRKGTDNSSINDLWGSAILLNNELSTRDKEILALLYYINKKAKELGITTTDSNIVKVNLDDFEKIDIALKQTASTSFKRLSNLQAIEWDKRNHIVKLNFGWIKKEVNLLNGRKLEAFYKLLLKQL